EVLSGFAADVLGPRPLIAGHDAGAEIILRAIRSGELRPGRLVLLGNRLHAPPQRALLRASWRLATCTAAVPGIAGALSHGTRVVFTPNWGLRLSARGNPGAADLVRQAFADVPGNSRLARSWAKCARNWPRGTQRDLLDLYPRLDMPVLLLWSD